MTQITIGLIVGIIMGLTGSGGALVSIPLFIELTQSTLKEATVLSLMAVIIGTLININGQTSKINTRISITIGLSGVMANYGSLSLKNYVSDIFLAGLLTIIATYSLISVWSKKPDAQNILSSNNIILKSVIAGALLGVLTTISGLGGGVLLMPILIKIFGMSYSQALPTSLATILVISISSFLFQFNTAVELVTFSQVLYLVVGVIVSYVLLKLFIRKVRASKVDRLRKIVFSLVAIYSAISIILKAM